MVSMPRSRGGPCDNQRNVAGRLRVSSFLCRVLAAVPATEILPPPFQYLVHVFLCRVLAAVPATLTRAALAITMVCRFYAAFSRRSLRPRVACPGYFKGEIVSMPRSRGGPCDCSPFFGP